ncbi:E3 ubiquitin-protein ligase WAV3-like [Lycium ferocissimum]|uniref:E3 ubiquitin-protein ligase WAV3-like n=1 Tax=Lycium ferocissimum TaxID=112874 RepID=UPI0028155843|nr:E3 ubiquitin-protein ligase WAV3-like [Lycium ferocissimum]
MGSKWRKAKLALGLNMCLYVPKTLEDSPATVAGERFSDVVSLSPTSPRRHSDCHVDMPTTPTPSSSGLRLPKQHSYKSSKSTCAICLMSMKAGQGHAIFTAECSHSFHFNCITSNVKHGNQICPVCRAKWKEIPFQSPLTDNISHPRSRNGHVHMSEDDAWMTVVRRIPPARLDTNRNISTLFQTAEPGVFDDDEVVDHQSFSSHKNSSTDVGNHHSVGAIEVKTWPEISAVSKSASHKNFAVLVHLKAPHAGQSSRAPVDLVTVLDVSGSMAGTKLALLKRAMGFVIQNLGPADRLSVIAFSSTARRLFPLRRMSDTGKQEALQAVNSLSSNGGTNIAEALKKSAKIMTERKWKNPVSSIILLSDGQDTYTVNSPSVAATQINYRSLLPVSMQRINAASGLHIPVHAFGFGADHDAVSMHSISEASGGTFSFIEAESVIQDAFAQCIGGLLSVVVQELRVEAECVHPVLRLSSIKAGSYNSSLTSDNRSGNIEVGDLYADEERDFLVMIDIPADNRSSNDMTLVKFKCTYRDPLSKDLVTLDDVREVKIERPDTIGQLVVSMEVDKQRNRLRSAEAMAEARAAAENGDLGAAVSVLERCRIKLSETVSAQAGDRLCLALDAELTEMQERMANRRVYETSGRAYVLSGLSSHSWQRATARGDSTDSTSLIQAYQTPSMVDMVSRSQTMYLGSPAPRPRPHLRPVQSFPARQQPR